MTLLNSSNSLVQTQVPYELRGRVMGIYTLVFSGALPIGSLLAGTLASSIGEPLAVVVGASVLLVVALIVLIHVQEFKQAE